MPCEYLNRWASGDGRLWTYRILVSHPHVPLWKRSSPAGVAYHAHLYTQIVGGTETDRFERWLDTEFESPAQESLQKATTDARLTPEDWKRLIRFVALQDLRTPARLEEEIKHWDATIPGWLEKELRRTVSDLEMLIQTGGTIPMPLIQTNCDRPPLQIIRRLGPDQQRGQIEARVVIGREFWLWAIKLLLATTAKVLHQHKWTIVHPPAGLAWFTSDSPVLRLNFAGASNYNFGGGWGSRGTEIILPLGPKHLLYTQIGKSATLRRGERLQVDHANAIRRMIAEHAHRLIFSADCDPDVPRLRPRTVNEGLFRSERELWASWHARQTAADSAVAPP